MVEVFVVVYLVISLPAAFLLWTALRSSKRLDDESQSMELKSLGNAEFFEAKTESIDLHLS